MSLFSQIKKVLGKENACVVSRNGDPKYVVMNWDKYQKIVKEVKELKEEKEKTELNFEEEKEYDIDINDIPI